ncbi:MAG: NFACT RNA binding domain-containing protein [Chlorobiales bacterium]|nr:NFACT RNA binding domain-containing protein [Chlorobiales bacterium]
MLRNYFTLYHLAVELQELLEEGYVFEVFSQQRNEIIISLITNRGNHLQLLIVTGRPDLCIYTREGLNRKRRNTAELLPQIAEKKISGVMIDPRDRIIRMALENSYVLVLQLFSAKTNVLLENEGKIISCFKENNTPYAFKEKENTAPRPEILRSLESLANDPRHFAERFQGTTAKETRDRLLQILPGFDRQLVRELLARCGGDDRTEKIHAEFATLFYELLAPLPSVNTDGKNNPEFSILHNPPKSSVKLETVMEGLNLYSRKTWQYLKTKALVNELHGKLKDKTAKIERELAHFQPNKLRQLADDYELNGHLLIANLYNPARKKESITVTNVFDSAAHSMTIRLKPELTLQQNAALWFQKASKTREKIEGGLQRNRVIKEQKLEIERLTENVQELSTPLQVNDFIETNRLFLKNLGLSGLSEKSSKQLPFRKFPITRKAVLYVGKNSRNNEQLTFSFAKPHDIWLHARGAAGSHCILRGATMQNISEIRQAAAIAAFYSSARHSEYVPVIYTEKKHVRRSRNLPPGQVIAEREKVIMVRPSRDGL